MIGRRNMDVGIQNRSNQINVSVVMPAYNEELNVSDAVSSVIRTFDELGILGELIVVDDGSTDRTNEIVSQFRDVDQRVQLVLHESNQGIGRAFWTGVDRSIGASVTMLPGDNENDPIETLRYVSLLEHVDFVVPFVFNKEVRSLFRNTLSFVYRFIINSTFLVHFNYTNGTVIYRRNVLDAVEVRNDGFFFQTDILVRSVKSGFLFAEVPYRLSIRRSGKPKAVSFPSFLKVVKGYLRLVRDLYSFRHSQKNRNFDNFS